MSDYMESLFQSVDILIDRRLNDLSYDTTEICTIVDDSKKKNGEYRVTDGSVTYIAYSDQNNFRNGEQVRVNIPKGDYSQKKFIIGKYVTDEDASPITYVSPVDTVIDLSGNLLSNSQYNRKYGIIANGVDSSRIIYSKKFTDQEFANFNNVEIWNSITLKANFKTTFDRSQPIITGTYGLRLVLYTKPSEESSYTMQRTLDLSSKEMFGNPYNFILPSPQSKVFDITSFNGVIIGFDLLIYQDGNFRHGHLSGVLASPSKFDNIIAENIVLGFGSNLLTVENNTLKIYSTDSPKYKYNPHNEATNKKKIGLLWYNSDENNKFVGFSDGIYDYDYDELEYLQKARVNTRLMAQKGRDGIPIDKESLNLAANIEEAVPLIEKAVKIISQDMKQLLQEMARLLDDNDTLYDATHCLLASVDGHKDKYLIENTDEILSLLHGKEGAYIGLVEQYKRVLQYGYNVWTGSTEAVEINFPLAKNYHEAIQDKFVKIDSVVNNLFTTDLASVEGEFSGYKSIRDTYYIRAKRLLAMMWGYLGKLIKEEKKTISKPWEVYYEYYFHNKYFPSGFFDNDYATLADYGEKSKESYTKYVEPNLSEDDNKYCIYWYRYEDGYEAPDGDSIMPSGWRRLNVHDAFKSIGKLDKETDFKKGIHYYKTDKDTYQKAKEYKEDTEYYICVSEADSDKINIGLSSKYYYTDDLLNSFKYVEQKSYIKNLKYYKKKSETSYEYVSDIKDATTFESYSGDLYVRVCINDKGQIVHAPKTSSSTGYIERYMQYDWEEERYMAVLFYNHNMYKSNELVFTNQDNIPDKTTADQGDILIFEHIKNSLDNYPIYAIDNTLMDGGDEGKVRQIRCHYDGLLAKDNALVGGQIFWYVPNEATMLTIDVDDLLNNKGFAIDEKRTVYKTDTSGKVVYKKVKFTSKKKYQKNKYYYYKVEEVSGTKTRKLVLCAEDPNTENTGHAPTPSDMSTHEDYKGFWEKEIVKYCFYKTINATEKENSEDEKYEWDKWIYESTINNIKIDNRDFWYKIKPQYQECANNYIECEFIQKEGADTVSGIQLFNFGIRGTNGTKYTLSIERTEQGWATTPSSELNLKATIMDTSNQILNFEDTIDGFKIEWFGATNLTEGKDLEGGFSLDKSVSTEVTFAAPAHHYGILRATGKVLIGKDPAEGSEPEKEKDLDRREATAVGQKRKPVDLEVLYPVASSPGDYFISGPTKIIYNSLGTLDNQSRFDGEYKLFTRQAKKIGEVNYAEGQEISNVKWSIKYYKINNKKQFVELTDSKDFYKQYMPKMQNNNLVPAPMYLTGLDCYAVVFAKIGDDVYWRQPIIILQNRYGSSMLNDWDGSFYIDEENGTIMGTMFGAGKKEDDNTFSGVLMGNVALGTGSDVGFEDGDHIGLSNQTGMGLYGFHHGDQSFGFNIDGTAFLGKSGSGRIIFNGTHGTIASANWYLNGGEIDLESGISGTSTDGMCIDLDNGQIDAYNFKLTSKNIYLNSNPTSSSLSHIKNSKDVYNNYYLRIGEENRTGYIGLNADGELEIRVNQLQITGNLGNENLLKQTSPRKTMLIPYWVPIKNVKSAQEERDADGKVTLKQTKEEDPTYKEFNNPGNGRSPKYTYDVSKWTKRKKDSGDSEPTYFVTQNWSHDKKYTTPVNVTVLQYNSTTKDLGNIWTNGSNTIDPNSSPPADNDKWTPYIQVVTSGDKKYVLKIHGENTWITQSIALRANNKYTVSGYFKGAESTNIFKVILGSGCTLEYSNLDDEIINKAYDEEGHPTNANTKEFNVDDSWHYFRCTFKSPDNTNPTTVGFTCNNSFYLWHAKLEEGSVATAWCPAPDDVEENIEGTKNNYDNYLNQDNLFNKLFKDKNGHIMDGIILLDEDESLSGRKELYISATYMASGILRSKNWDGTLQSKYDDVTQRYKYTIKTPPKKGMYINLDEGNIWAAQFKLNAWDYDKNSVEKGHGLYLNSDPETSDYYLKLGNLQQSYITFSAAGDLRIRANSFYLTETLGGSNLLKQTNPKRTVLLKKAGEKDYVRETNGTVKCDWDVSKWAPARHVKASPQPTSSTFASGTYYSKSGNVYTKEESFKSGTEYYVRVLSVDDTTESDKVYIIVREAPAASKCEIKQTVSGLETGKAYTVSGYAKKEYAGSNISFDIAVTNSKPADGSNKLDYTTIKNADWSYFEYTFIPTNSSVTVKFSSSAVFCLWHAKLEKGTVATTWSESDWDIAQNTEDTKNIFDQYLVQDQIFDKLTIDPTTGNRMVGIWMVDAGSGSSARKELYINATYIATGVLRSSNWVASYKFKGDTTSYSQDNLQEKLSNGKSAADIESITVSQGTYFNLDTGHLWTKDLTLEAGSFSSTDTNANYLGLFSSDQTTTKKINNTTLSTWRIIAGNKFGVTKDGSLYASNAYITGTISSSQIESDHFNVSADGHLEATSAELTSLTVYNTLTVAKGTGTGDVSIAGDITLSGNATFDGKLTFKTGSTIVNGSSTSEYISFASNGLFLYGSLIDLSSAEIEIGASARTAAGGTPSQVEFWGDATTYGHFTTKFNAYVESNIYFDGTINAKESGSVYKKGITNSYKVKTKWFESKKLVFYKGLLVDVLDKDGKSVEDGEGINLDTDLLPDISDTYANNILAVTSNGKGVEWKPISSALGAKTSEARQFLICKTDGTIDWQQVNANDILTTSDSTGKVLSSDGKNGVWQTLGATLVNFTDGTTTGITKGTSGTDTYYEIKASKSVSVATKSATPSTGHISNWYLCWNNADVTSDKKVTTYETTSSTVAATYDHYTLLSLDNRAYTYYDITTSTQTVEVDKKVKINITLT